MAMTDDELRKIGAEFIRRKQQEGVLDELGNFITLDSGTSVSPSGEVEKNTPEVTHGAFMSGFRNRYAESNFKESANDQMKAYAAINGYAGSPYEYMDKDARNDVYKTLWQESQAKARNAQDWKEGNMSTPQEGWWDSSMYWLGGAIANLLPAFLGGIDNRQEGINDAFRYLISLGYSPEEAMVKAQSGKVNVPENWNNLRGTVFNVIDGDTIDVLTGDSRYPVQHRVRVGGVNAPEIPHPEVGKDYGEYFGQQAMDFTADNVLGKQVYLDIPYMPIDKYGRTIANVYTTSGDERGAMLSELLVRGGYGKPLNIEPNSQYKELLEQAQKEAMAHKVGMYGPIRF